jgi:hypothetical protein
MHVLGLIGLTLIDASQKRQTLELSGSRSDENMNCFDWLILNSFPEPIYNI